MNFSFEEEVPKSTVVNSLWVEKYRPDKLEGYIGNEQLKQTVASFITRNDIPHLLFYGTAGTGKCLDYSQEIDVIIELSEEEYNSLKKYELQ